MRILLKNGSVVNVFTDRVERCDVLIEDEKILGVGDYGSAAADVVEDLTGKFICPGFVDGHIHIESTMLTPAQFVRVCLPHGTTAVVADPHEIANVCGSQGIEYMLAASEGLPMDIYVMLPSCVPATPMDESGAILEAEDLYPFYSHPRVLGLGEMMNYPGVLAGEEKVMKKISDALALGKLVNGHAPLLTGAELDRYIAAGVSDDHECSSEAEAKERIGKGQWVMIRQGTAARDLAALLPLFEEPWSRRCLLVTDDRHPADLLTEGHIDHIVRLAAEHGRSVVTAIRMATRQAAEYFGLRGVGAVAPGYRADLLVLDDLENVRIRDVYFRGAKVVSDAEVQPFAAASIPSETEKAARESFHLPPLCEADFHIEPQGRRCRVIRLRPGQLLTEEWVTELDFEKGNGVDLERDILKIAVIERHHATGHKGLGFIAGTGMKKGAIAASVSHDAHNLIVIGTNEGDMALAANRVRAMGGGNVVVEDGCVLAEMPLPIAGLMSDLSAQEAAARNEQVRRGVERLGTTEGIEPFMNMAFLSLAVIPSLKITTKGLVDVERQILVPLFLDGQDIMFTGGRD